MRVLEPGREQRGWSKEVKCTGEGNGGGGCGAKLLVEQLDLFQTASGHHDGSTDYYITIECPQCFAWTDLPDGSVPSHACKNLPRRRR